MTVNITPWNDEQIDDERPLPLIVADQWDFPLQHYETGDGYLYSIHDWIKGLTSGSPETARKSWENIRSEVEVPTFKLDYLTQGGVFQTDFTTDKGLYLIAQNLRSTAKRPQLKEIKHYLSDAGVFADEVRRNPDQAIEQIEDYRNHRDYKRLIASGMAHDEAVQWLDTRAKQKRQRPAITQIWQQRGAEGRDYATLSNAVTEGATGKTATQLKRELQVTNPRDHLSTAENAAIAGIELFSSILHTSRDSQGVNELSEDIHDGASLIDRDAIRRVFSKTRPTRQAVRHE